MFLDDTKYKHVQLQMCLVCHSHKDFSTFSGDSLYIFPLVFMGALHMMSGGSPNTPKPQSDIVVMYTFNLAFDKDLISDFKINAI